MTELAKYVGNVCLDNVMVSYLSYLFHGLICEKIFFVIF